nr:MAG TPA: portal protein [Bacteriophage sp.]
MNNTSSHTVNKAWQQYERGKEYKQRIGLYETVRQNERFYCGEQWQYGEGKDLPRPVFNIIYRVMNYLICSVASSNISLRFTDENLPYAQSGKDAEIIQRGIDILTENAAYRWKKEGMDRTMLEMLTDAAITGDGVVYCYWDSSIRTPHRFDGDIVTDLIDNVNVFPADVNNADIQSQDYIILAGRTSVKKLIEEARAAGVSEEEIKRIVPDTDCCSQSGEMAGYELEGDDEAKATYIIKFWKENGKVLFEKSTKECVIRRGSTDCRLYPVAFFNWIPRKNSFHGSSPVSALIPNQKFINRAYAMVMKHMTDTAFSKIVYDKSKIPEWSNEVGEAIASFGGGNVADSVSVVGVGEMQSGYMELIDSAVNLTKELMGATDSALGNLEANNTSAILALQETSRIPLEQIRSAYYRVIEDIANIWADMMCAYYPSERLLPCYSKGSLSARKIEFSAIKNDILCAEAEISEISRYSAVSVQNMLDRLLDGGYINAEEYVRRLPLGALVDREGLLEEIKSQRVTENNGVK